MKDPPREAANVRMEQQTHIGPAYRTLSGSIYSIISEVIHVQYKYETQNARYAQICDIV